MGPGDSCLRCALDHLLDADLSKTLREPNGVRGCVSNGLVVSNRDGGTRPYTALYGVPPAAVSKTSPLNARSLRMF
eukprot:9622968-Lingulodinium_polyedra.AAC.1